MIETLIICLKSSDNQILTLIFSSSEFKILIFSFTVKILSSFFFAEFLIIAVDKINEKITNTKNNFFHNLFPKFSISIKLLN